MARSRSIPTDLYWDIVFCEMSSDTQSVLIALNLLADDAGRGSAHLRLLSRQVNKPVEVIEPALQELERVKFIQVYQANGQSYYQLTRWHEWQTLSKPTPSRIPEPPQIVQTNPSDYATVSKTSQENPGLPRETPLEEKRRRKEDEGEAEAEAEKNQSTPMIDASSTDDGSGSGKTGFSHEDDTSPDTRLVSSSGKSVNSTEKQTRLVKRKTTLSSLPKISQTGPSDHSTGSQTSQENPGLPRETPLEEKRRRKEDEGEAEAEAEKKQPSPIIDISPAGNGSGGSTTDFFHEDGSSPGTRLVSASGRPVQSNENQTRLVKNQLK